MKIVSSRTADSKPVKQEVNSTVKLPPLVFPGTGVSCDRQNILIVQSTGLSKLRQALKTIRDKHSSLFRPSYGDKE